MNIQNRFRDRTLQKDSCEPSLSDDQKIKRKQFSNWLRINFRKGDTLRILFSEKNSDIDGVHNSYNEGVWTTIGADADEREVMSCRNKSSTRESNSVVGCLLL